MTTIEIVLMWHDGRISRTNIAIDDTGNVIRVGADGVEREFEPTGTINDEGVELYRELTAGDLVE